MPALYYGNAIKVYINGKEIESSGVDVDFGEFIKVPKEEKMENGNPITIHPPGTVIEALDKMPQEFVYESKKKESLSMVKKLGFLAMCFSACAAGSKWTQGVTMEEIYAYVQTVYNQGYLQWWESLIIYGAVAWGGMYANASRVREYWSRNRTETWQGKSRDTWCAMWTVIFAPVTAPFALVMSAVEKGSEEESTKKA